MIKSVDNTHALGRVSAGEADLLASLGEQLKLDPEMAALMSPEGELPADFKQALKEMSFEDAQALVDKLTQETEKAGLKQEQLNQQLHQLLPENVTRLSSAKQGPVFTQAPQEPNELQALLAKGNSTPETALAKAEMPQGVEAKQIRNAEDATRAFMPQRKSIFAVQKEMAQPTPAQASNVAKVQNSQGLVDLNEFMAKQSPSVKHRALGAHYKNEHQSMLANKMFAEKQLPHLNIAPVEGESASFEDMSQGQDQLIPQKLELPVSQSASGSQKVFDLGTLSRTNDLDSVISQIQDYIVQAKASKDPSAQVTFNHPELGDVDIFVKKGMGDQVHVTIGHQSQEAAKFFRQHQGELLQTLQQSGVQVGEFKLESSASQNSNNNSNGNSFDQNGRQFANQSRSGEEQQRREDSHRREELWKLLHSERKSA